MKRLAAAVVAAAFAVSTHAGAPSAAAGSVFAFHPDEFWLNLHHFLYVLGRAEAKLPDASRNAVAAAPADSDRGLNTLTPDERQAWRDAIAFYASGPSRKDAVFDEPLPAIAHALVDAGDRESLADLAAIDAGLRATLERAAPIYKKAWWPAHHAANLARRDVIQALVDRHGAAVLAFITRAYGMAWPADGYPVHMSSYANWAGAYSTTGNLLVVSSLDAATQGFAGLETVFHEGMHQWDEALNDALFAEARRSNKRIPRGLSHAMIFFTAGEAVRRVAPNYVPYTDAAGVWARGMQPLKAALQAAWQPHLDGRGSREDAIVALIATF